MEDAVDQAGSCLIYSRVHHRLATVTMRESVLGWVQSGRKTLHSPRQTLTINPGQAFVVGRGSQWDVENDPAGSPLYRALILSFSAELLADFFRTFPQFSDAPTLAAGAVLSFDSELQEALTRAVALMQVGLQADLQRHRLLEVLYLLAVRGVLWSSQPLRWDERLRRHIGQRPQAAWTMPQLAAAFHTSPATLRRRLQQCQTSVSEIVREVRLETALALLQTTDLAVGEIAGRCGYDSHSRFSAAFRSRYGFAPSALRQEGESLSLAAQLMSGNG